MLVLMTEAAQRKLILIADIPEGAEAVKACLSPHHDLVLVHSLAAATRLIENVDFDAIICGTHFDDSRMIELLKEVRTDSRYSEKPFVIVRVVPTNLTAEIEANAKQMALVLGATAYITIDEFCGDTFSEELLRRVHPVIARR
jgi:CheY-like chemotaxis protein